MKTFLHQGLVRGIALGRKRADGLPTRRVMVTLTDGIDDASGAGDDEVSSRHARLVSADERVLLEDLDSTNGTYLNVLTRNS